MGEAFVQRIARRVDDVARRFEVWFANLEMNNVTPLGLKRLRFHQNFERCLCPQARHAVGQTKLTFYAPMHCRSI